ncbi:MAG: baseplate J/gp47 family protein [Thermoanaerobacteraceae bacterium]|nr:baseplate J/gp47 family protein [Thermoanaerobacteraceae bacterium]
MAELPSYLEDQTFEAILQRMLDALPDDWDKSEGNPIYNALAPVAAELAQAAIWAQEVLRRGFAQTTFGQYLDLRAAEHGLTRKSATKATGQVTFTGTPGTVIPAETQVSTEGSEAAPAIFFTTTEEVTIGEDGAATASIEAVETGASGNVAAGTITMLAQPVTGVTSVTNTSATTGGTDEETDESLLERFLQKVRQPGTSGNKADYINWALEVSGIGGAQVIPLWNGPGTVKVVLLGTDKKPASTEVVQAVQNYIAPTSGTGEGKAPIGADVTVVAATPVEINISAIVVLTGTKTLQEVQATFEKALDDYLASIAFASDPTVRYVKIGSLLLDTEGVQDYSNLLVNNGTANVTIGLDEVAVRGTVTLNE